MFCFRTFFPLGKGPVTKPKKRVLIRFAFASVRARAVVLYLYLTMGPSQVWRLKNSPSTLTTWWATRVRGLRPVTVTVPLHIYQTWTSDPSQTSSVLTMENLYDKKSSLTRISTWQRIVAIASPQKKSMHCEITWRFFGYLDSTRRLEVLLIYWFHQFQKSQTHWYPLCMGIKYQYPTHLSVCRVQRRTNGFPGPKLSWQLSQLCHDGRTSRKVSRI